MSGSFELIDYLIFGLYAVTILSIGLWVSRDKKGKQKNAEDYFLASKSLPWWAVGASLIAANISAEQFIGMSGSCLLYTSPSPRDKRQSRMPSSA